MRQDKSRSTGAALISAAIVALAAALCAIALLGHLHGPAFVLVLTLLFVAMAFRIVNTLLRERRAERVMEERARELHAAHERLAVDARFVEMTKDLALTVDFNRNIVSCNNAWEDATGWTLKDLQACPLRDRMHPDDVPALLSGYEALRSGGSNKGIPVRLICKDGSWRWLEWNSIGVPEDGLIYCSARDVTERVELEGSLEIERKHLRNAQQIARIGSWRVEFPSGHTYWSDELYKLLAFEQTDEPPNFESWIASLAPREIERAKNRLFYTLKNGGEFEFEFERAVPGPGGEPVFLATHGLAEMDEQGTITRLTGTVVDISERKRYEAGLRFIADHDPLTSLPNRRQFDTVIDLHLAQCRREGTTGGLILIDLDKLKSVNDQFGHLAGDDMIKHLGNVLRMRTRDSELAARIGGDEFVALLPSATLEGCRRYALSVLDMMAELSPALKLLGIETVTASIGIAMFNEIGVLEAETAIAAADDAMYSAKRRGPGNVEEFHRFVARLESVA